MYKARIKTLTPIWTGNVERECNVLRETSLIGSLRWWFEVIVRGFGCYACDSVGNVKCEYKSNTKEICGVCEVFGATGWAKRFRFEIDQSFRRIYEDAFVIKGNRRSWYYPSGVVSCGDTLNKICQIFNLNTRTDIEINTIFKVLFSFISNWGMVGGKTAIGYGVIRFEDENGNLIKPNNEDVETFFGYLEEKKEHGKNAVNAPKLDEMFFAKFKVKKGCIDKIIEKVEENISSLKNGKKQFPSGIFKCNGVKENINDEKKFLHKLKDCYGFIPTSALIKRELRKEIRKKWNDDKLRHFLMGNVQMSKNKQKEDPTRFSAIQVSHIYWTGENWEFRMWGWIPKNLERDFDVKRKEVIEFIKELLDEEDFWNSVFGNCIEKIIKYPSTNWNFIDFGERNATEEVRNAFKSMIAGDENG